VYTGPSVDKKECLATTCEVNEKVLPDGSCQKCRDYTIVSNDKRDCVHPDVEINEIINPDGSIS